MTEIDDLIAVKGVMIAGRFGPDWSLAEHKVEPLFIEVPAAMSVLGTFCAAISIDVDGSGNVTGRIDTSALEPGAWMDRFWW